MIPVLLAQEIDGINHTLELIDQIGTIESIPGALLVMGVLLFLGIVIVALIFWRMNTSQIKVVTQYIKTQQQATQNAQSNYIVERDVTAVKLDTLVDQTENTNRIIEGYHGTLKGLTEQMAQTAQYLAETAKALKTLEQRVVASEAEAIDRWAKVETVGRELKTNMDELENGNQKILEELQIIRAELKRVADSVEDAMTNLIVAVDKLTKPDRLTVIKTETQETDQPEDTNA